MRFKVGDKVRIKDNLKNIKDFQGRYIPELEKYVGQICTIKEFICNGKAVAVKENDWTWDIRALEKVQFTKSDLKDGDIVTLKNNKQGIVTEQGETIKYLKGITYMLRTSCYNNNLTRVMESERNLDIIKVDRPTQYETVFERKEEILDEAEKSYLRGVIRPFRDRLKTIVKYQSSNETNQYIKIDLNNDYIVLPYFEKDIMYKNMKLRKEYTLEELGL